MRITTATAPRSGIVGDLAGVITIPAIAGLCRLTQQTVFGPASAGVRDGYIAPLRAQSEG